MIMRARTLPLSACLTVYKPASTEEISQFHRIAQVNSNMTVQSLVSAEILFFYTFIFSLLELTGEIDVCQDNNYE